MSTRPKTFCVIEDNEVIRRLFVLLIEKEENTVVQFADGESAVEWIVEHQPDIILCDIMLPGINGTDILHLVRSLPRGGDIKIIALTAFARHGDREKYLSQGFDGYISKPVDPQTFLNEVYAIAQL